MCKIHTMTAADKSTVQRLVQLRTGRDLEEHLRELYVERRLTDQEIAGLLGVHRMTVGEWRREFGIDRSARTASLA
jgi:hypothetical protein